ncbi:sigma factor [Pseudobutyrivibrio ruminis]|uniref:sigma factor n=1 Tax=Pseudobutyrivibrio ruminis TaxID=46206 RepID=UPI00142F3B13|nr:sigma factor [Pseudobutyrivibrio ruminis]
MEIAYDLDINHWGGIYKEDMMQEGRIALLGATQTYDESNDAKFSTYAYTIVRNAMTDLCRKGISPYENRMIEAGYTQEFFDDYYARDKDGVHISETIGEAEFDPTARRAVLRVMIQKMQNRLKVLPPRLQRLLAYRYGFGMTECKSISEAAAFFILTEIILKHLKRMPWQSLGMV